MSKIKELDLEELDFIVSPYMTVFKIPKSIIFVDNINITR